MLQEHVVKKSETATLFEDLLQSKGRANAQTGPTHTENDLIEHVDNFLKAVGLPMTMRQYYEWVEEVEEYSNKKTGHKKEDKKRKANIIVKSLFKKDKYEKVIEAGKEDWLLSTDGVVKALHYKKENKQFVAKVHYKKGTKVMEEQIAVSDDWVIDTYGKDVVNKLMDREEHSEFIKPVTSDGRTTVLKLDDRTITRVKYVPPKYIHKYDER
jgi:hypothetical protein